LAETRIKRQRIEEAATELMELKNRIEEMLPDEQYLTYLLLGNCLVNQNKLDEAESLFQEAIAINESGERAYLSLGSVNLLRKQFDQAEQNFHQALKRNPNQPKAHFGLGMVLWNQGDKESGLRKYQEALDQDINHIQALYSLTTAASELNRWDVAATYLEKYVAKNPSQTDFLFSLGGVYYRMGRFSDAQEICQRILRQQPNHEPTKELVKKIQRDSTQ
jgi:tetratricopeptide (TPR) repeat protein